MSTPHFHRLTVADVRRETPDAVSIAFAVPPELAPAYRFRQGQYLTLRATLDGEEVRRSYSICTGLDDGEVRVAVKRVADGVFSRFANENLKPGDAIDVMTPMGRFTTELDPAAGRLYLGVACGSGITPVLSILRTVLAREPKSRFVLVYGNRTARDILFKSALEDLKDRFLGRLTVHHVLSREPQDVPLLSGRIDGDRLAALLRTAGEPGDFDHVFLCGPAGMTEEARRTLEGLGVAHDRIHAELFTPASPTAARHAPKAAAKAGDAPAATATVLLDGAAHTVPVREGESIIDAGQRAGLDLPFSCKGGMCCTCRAKLVEGTVTMDENWSLEPWEIEQGFVLACQSHPTSPAVTLDFDQV